MTMHEYLNLRINQVDRIAAKQSGLPTLFYTIKRCYGDNEASNYLHTYKNAMPYQKTIGGRFFIAVGNTTRF